MFFNWYCTRLGHTAAGNKVTMVGGWDWETEWLPYITGWKFVGFYIAYNVTDNMVAK